MTDCNNINYTQLLQKAVAQINEYITLLHKTTADFAVTTTSTNIINIQRLSDNKQFSYTLSIEDFNQLCCNNKSWISKFETLFNQTYINVPPVFQTSDQWIIKFNEGFNPENYEWPSQMQNIELYDKNFYNGMCCSANAEHVENFIKNNPNIIESCYKDTIMSIKPIQSSLTSTSQRTEPFIKRINAHTSSQKSGDNINGLESKTNINVFVVDTGISKHPELNIVGGRNFTTTNTEAWNDGNGHGTHVAGIIGAKDNTIGVVGVAPGVRLWALKTLSDTGSGLTSSIIAALQWILKNRDILWSGFGVVNMSLGGPAYQPLDDAVNALINNGIVVCVAAGNEGIDASTKSPARVPNAITVGATGPLETYNTLASYSNYGKLVDILAPGTNIYSTYISSGYQYASGTSMATPIVSGGFALMFSTVNLGIQPTTLNFVLLARKRVIDISQNRTITLRGVDTVNPRITLTPVALAAGTTDISINVGGF